MVDLGEQLSVIGAIIGWESVWDMTGLTAGDFPMLELARRA
jgi:hypothetical protein